MHFPPHTQDHFHQLDPIMFSLFGGLSLYDCDVAYIEILAEIV